MFSCHLDGLIQTSLETSGTYQLTAQSYPSQATWMLPNLGSQGKTTGVLALRIDSLVLGPHSRLTVYGGTGQQAPKVAEFTHSMTNAPVVYVPSARVVYSTGVSDTDSSNISMVLVRASYSLLSDCGGNLSLPSGVVTTPQYPNQYPFNANCTWRLPKLKSRKLHMALTDLVLVSNHSVRVLAVNITSVANHTRYVTTELASYSSNRSLPASDLLVENTDELWVNFQSTANGSGEVKVARGFQASYEDMKCGGRRSTDGVVNTPGFPKLVKGDTTCVWIISLPATTGKKPRIISFKYEIRPLLQNDTSSEYFRATPTINSDADWPDPIIESIGSPTTPYSFRHLVYI
ncbi:hypothetical protein LSAT2_023596 [Lamellibrachia satsuma]|nr:hypothetical protein LSAT2_023596 [Lamellibrachia satsuma]